MQLTTQRVPQLTAALLCCMMVGCGGEKNKSPATSPPKAQPAAAPTPNPLTRSANSAPATEPARTQLPSQPATGSQRAVQSNVVQRRSDDRVVQNPERFKASGIRRYESKRLILYTDFDPQIAQTLPPMADVLFDHLTKFFGQLPANREGTDFQATGYLMADPNLFRKLGLLTDRVPAFENGRHMGYEFWVNGQKEKYYSRHLVFHEFTHCFMACTTGTVDAPPAWYMEGMAEYFGTHRLNNGAISFGVMPENLEDYKGFGRIGFLNRAVQQKDMKSTREVMNLGPTEQAIYPWSWALCRFLIHQPDITFREIGTHLTRNGFQTKLTTALGSNNMLEARWSEFLDKLSPGYDIPRAAIQPTMGVALGAGESKQLTVAADRGWQSTGILLGQGSYEIKASGRFQVSDQVKPWISEPNGVSINYIRNQRLGCLLGTCYDPNSPTFANSFKVGTGRTVTDQNGTLFLRVNDAMNSLANNKGEVNVTIRRLQ